MKCLSQRQLARFALGSTEDAELTTHLETCAVCRAGLEAMQSLRHELAEAHANLNEGHEAARERLLAILPAASRPPERTRPWKQISQWMGGLTMIQRIAVGSVGVATLLGFLLLWGAIGAKPLSAMEKMAEEVRKAKSYKSVNITRETPDAPLRGQPAVKIDIYTVYWRAPGTARIDILHAVDRWRGPGPEWTKISVASKSCILINHQTKKFYRRPAPAWDEASPEKLETLGRFSGEADRDLGTREINGKKVRGFEIAMKKMNAESRPGTAEIWLDPQSDLPVLVRYKGIKIRGGQFESEHRDIQWNIDLEPNLFDATPPKDYVDDTPKPLTLTEQVRQINAALRVYVEASGGPYPRESREKLVHDDVYDVLSKTFGVIGVVTPAGEKKLKKLQTAYTGFNMLRDDIENCNTGFAYNGNTVGPKDKDKVLLRWKLDDGRYEVIFGDLRAETVAADRLCTLEGK
jgi:hypothetical protein